MGNELRIKVRWSSGPAGSILGPGAWQRQFDASLLSYGSSVNCREPMKAALCFFLAISPWVLRAVGSPKTGIHDEARVCGPSLSSSKGRVEVRYGEAIGNHAKTPIENTAREPWPEQQSPGANPSQERDASKRSAETFLLRRESVASRMARFSSNLNHKETCRSWDFSHQDDVLGFAD